MRNILEIKDLSFSYETVDNDKLTVIKGIDISVRKGEFLSIIGSSGCGKSTFLRLIGGFIKPESGRIMLNGKEIKFPDENRVMVFQDFNQLFPWQTVLQNVVFPLKMKRIGTSRKIREEMARRILYDVQLSEFENYYPYQLSGGMKQRVALARSLVTSPEILLMDEPFASLDSQTRDSLQELVVKIWRETGSTIIFVTHDIREALLLSDRIVVMGKKPGRITRVIDNDLDWPRNQAVRDYKEIYKELCQLF